MEILFIILKIIGLLLAVVLLLCCALLLVPIRYRVDLKAQDEIEGKAVVHWLFHLLDVRIFYRERDISFKIRIFGIAVPLDKGKKEKEPESADSSEEEGQLGRKEELKGIPQRPSGQAEFRESAEGAAAGQQEETEGQRNGHPQPEETKGQRNGYLQLEVTKSQRNGHPQPEETEGQETDTEAFAEQSQRPGSLKRPVSGNKNGRKNRKKPGFFQKIKLSFHKFREKMKEIPGKLRQKRSDIKTGADTAKGQIGNIKSMILEETNQNAVLCMLREVRYLLRHYLPGKGTGTLRFSMGSPDLTGKALGAMSLLPFWARSKMVIMPDFISESFYLKGIVYITGHVRVLHVLVSGVRLIRDRNVRKLIANIRN